MRISFSLRSLFFGGFSLGIIVRRDQWSVFYQNIRHWKREIQLISMIFIFTCWMSSCDLHGQYAFVISIFFDDQETQREKKKKKKRDDLQIIPFALSRQFYVLIEKETHVEQLQPSPSFPYLLLFFLTCMFCHIWQLSARI